MQTGAIARFRWLHILGHIWTRFGHSFDCRPEAQRGLGRLSATHEHSTSTLPDLVESSGRALREREGDQVERGNGAIWLSMRHRPKAKKEKGLIEVAASVPLGALPRVGTLSRDQRVIHGSAMRMRASDIRSAGMQPGLQGEERPQGTI